MIVGTSVSHITDGRYAWKIGFLGLLVRPAGIFTITLITAFGSVTAVALPSWWPDLMPASVTLDLNYVFSALVLFLGAFLLASLWYLRKRTIRSLEMKYYLHRLVHDIRDRQTRLHKNILTSHGFSKTEISSELEGLLAQICENTATYFKLLTLDESIGIAIRLASVTEGSRSIAYKTYARSKSLNPHRQQSSEAIPINKGIPRFLRDDKHAQGILIYHDLKLASKDGTYLLTRNDNIFPNEVATMMVAPLNAWSGISQDMIGIIYVTSRHKSTFRVKHVDSFAFIADLTATTIANTVEIMRGGDPALKNGVQHAESI